jgi:hypothetical protein
VSAAIALAVGRAAVSAARVPDPVSAGAVSAGGGPPFAAGFGAVPEAAGRGVSVS